jgi:hypothetical protein
MEAIRATMNIPVRIVQLSFCKEAPVKAVVVSHSSCIGN